jgi:predicted site-specific integrase-resolvase
MVSKQKIKDYEFESIEDYYEYIVESIINGQRKQAKELVKQFSKKQMKEAYNYYNDRFEHFFGEAKQIVIDLM